MAANYQLLFEGYQGRNMYITCAQTADVATNTSTINWTLTVAGGTSSYYTTGPTSVKINGVEVYAEERIQWDKAVFPVARGSISGTTTVEHNEYGEASIPVSITTAIYVGASSASTVSGTWTLDSIPRKATLVSAPNFNDEENPTITYSNPAGEAVSVLQACIANDESILIVKDVSRTGTSYTFNLSDSERANLRQSVVGSNSRALRFILISAIGETEFTHELSRNYTIKNPLPTLNPVVKDTGTNSIALTGDASKMIQYFNNMAYTINAAAVKEATIVSQSVSCGSVKKTTNTGSFSNASSNTFVFTATDSRGNTVSKTITVPMISYIPLTCDVEASIALDAADSTKTTVRFTISGNYFNSSFGAQNNSLSLSYSLIYGSSGGASITPITIPSGAISGNRYSVDVEIEDLDYSGTYTVQAFASDKIATDVSSFSKTLKAKPIFDWGENDFNFNVPVAINGVEIDYPVEQGTKNGWYYRKWNSGFAECWYSASVSGIDVGEFNMNGFYYCGSKGVNFPFTFTSVDYVNASGGSTGNMNIVRPFNKTTTNMTYIVIGLADISNATVNINLEAKGRWK